MKTPTKRKPGRPKRPGGRKTLMRFPPKLAAECGQAMVDEGLSTADAAANCAELGLNLLRGKLMVVNDETWRAACLYISQRSVVAAMALIGVQAHVNETGEVVLTIPESVQPGEVTGHIPVEMSARTSAEIH